MPQTRTKPLADKIRAVTFDAGGTLIECWPSVGHIYADVAATHGYGRLSPAVLNRNFRAAWKACASFHHSMGEWSALVDATFGKQIRPAPSQTFFPQLYARFAQPEAWRVFDDVVPTLLRLKSRGITLGIISNWDDRLKPLLRALGLDRYFDAIVVSCEVGAPKPAHAIFQSACCALKCAPAETLHVGDSLEMDLRGAEAAGLQARWLRRGARRRPPGTIGSADVAAGRPYRIGGARRRLRAAIGSLLELDKL